MLKRKVLKVLPFWLTGLIFVIALRVLGIEVYFSQINQPVVTNAAAQSPQPQVLGAATSIRGEGAALTQNQVAQTSVPDLTKVTAQSFLAFDLQSGQNLLKKNTGQKLSIASLTKLLTGFVTYQNIDLDQNITITKQDVLKISPDLGFIAGDNVKASDIFNAMLIGSCNDAALTLGNYVGGLTEQNFPDLMNQQAQSLGMINSHFSNPMGFDDPANYSTAEDLKILITATQQLAVFRDLGRRTGYEFTGSLGQTYSTVATDKLIGIYPDIQAIKTGYTHGAQGAMATKITIGSHEVVVIVLDSKNREDDTLKLRSALLSSFKWQ